eukprot:scaffold16082_cov110-Isochrysis_galbana.AAC.6
MANRPVSSTTDELNSYCSFQLQVAWRYLLEGFHIETLLASGDSAGHPGLKKTLLLSLPFPIISPPLFLIQATFSGGMVQKLRAPQQPEV